MTPLLISSIAFACVLSGALLGLYFRLPDHFLNADTKDVVRLAMGMVATTAAMALGLLVGSAKSFFDTQNTEVAQLAANSVLLDRGLAQYGPEAQEARQKLRALVSGFSRLTLSHGDEAQSIGPDPHGEELYEAIMALNPQNESQRSIKNQALQLEVQMGQTRWLMFEQRAVPVPVPLLLVLVFWLVGLFTSFGLFAKPNATVIAGLVVSASAVSGAIFLVIEMYQPYSGVIRVSDEPIRAAMKLLGR